MIDGRRKPKHDDEAGGLDASADLDAAEGAATDVDTAAGDPTAGAAGGEPAGGAPGEEDRLPNVLLRFLRAIGPAVVRAGVSANHVTVTGIVVSAATGAAIALGHLWVAAGLLAFGGLMDTLDGAVAKAAGTSSKRGAFFDSVSDRVADMFVFGGLTWYLAAGPGHDPRMAVLPLAILGVANTISYERAKGELLGYDAKGGIMERAERLIVVGVALIFNVVLVPILLVLLGLCVWTAGQRFLKVWKQASRGLPTPASSSAVPGSAGPSSGGSRAKRPPRVESRWRAWREANGVPERRRQRVAVATSRTRSRRHSEPLTTRVRRAFTYETGARVGARGSNAGAGGRSRRVTSERRQQGAAAAFRRRLGSGR